MKKNCLILKFGALGDVLRTSYILPPLYIQYNIYWLTSIASKDLIKSNKFLECSFTKNEIQLYSSINFDLVISLDDEFEIVRLLDKFTYKSIVGSYPFNKSVKYTNSSSLWFDMGLISIYGKSKADSLKKKNKLSHDAILCKMLNIKNAEPYLNIDYQVLSKWNNYFKFKIPKNKKKLLVNLECGERWQAKTITLKQKKIFLSRLTYHLEKAYQIFIFNNNSPDNVVLKNNFPNIIFVDTSTSVIDYAAAIKFMDYVFTCDSLCLHLAIAQKIPNFSFFTVTSMNEINTFNTGVKIKSTSLNYCTYLKTSKSFITVNRLINNFLKFLKE